METIDTPVKLVYKDGNNFPPNFVMIGYIFIIVSIALVVFGSYLFGGILLLFALFAITNRHAVRIDPKAGTIHDYSTFLGFIKIGKKYPLNKCKYATAMPLIESQQVYSRSSNSTTITNGFTTVTFFGERFKGKIIITKFDTRTQARDTAIKLADRLGLKYFEYDPKLVGEVLLGQTTL